MSEIRDIRERLRKVSELLGKLEEDLSSIDRGFSNIESSMIKVVRKLVDLYYIIVDYMAGEEEIYRLVEGDDIKAWIIKILYQYNGMNILQLTNAVKERRGKASRRIISKKLKELEEKNLVRKEVKGRSKIYYLNI